MVLSLWMALVVLPPIDSSVVHFIDERNSYNLTDLLSSMDRIFGINLWMLYLALGHLSFSNSSVPKYNDVCHNFCSSQGTKCSTMLANSVRVYSKVTGNRGMHLWVLLYLFRLIMSLFFY